jgi:magnesium-protoporphyrin IX monomethyl ester (oxidative) cyclase
MQAAISNINSVEDAAKKAVTNTLFSPRFYTTDYEAMNRISVEPGGLGCDDG